MESRTALGSHYRLEESVGVGASGEVWRATDDRLNQEVAAKILHPHLSRDHEVLSRFIQERAVLTSLDHPAIIKVRDLIVDDGRLAIVMDFAPSSVAKALQQVTTMPPAAAAGIMVHVLDALAYAHRKEVLHRDIKPDNILLSDEWGDLDEGDVRLTDFGIAKVLGDSANSATSGIGTPAYMAPEIIQSGEAEPGSDVYSAGITLYEMLSGRTPFGDAKTAAAIGLRHLTEMPLPLEIPDELAAILRTMLAKDPQQRPTAAEAATQLRELLPSLQNLPALEPTPQQELRQGTLLKKDALAPLAAKNAAAASESDLIDLGPQGNATILKPVRDRAPVETTPEPSIKPKSRRRLVLIVAGAVVAVGIIVAVVLATGVFKKDPSPGEQSAPVAAAHSDQVLPTGLTISRTATYDSATQQVRLELSYATQNAPLTGPFLEVIPALENPDSCAKPSWDEGAATAHRPSETGFSARCGWRVDPEPIPAQSSVTVTAKIPTEKTPTQQELTAWLSSVSQATLDLVNDASIVSTAYPVQRLKGIQLEAPSRVVSQVSLDLTLVPVWASGPDALNPLYRSPSMGEPSSMLTAIAGDSGLRFADGCGGALRVSSNGLTVSTVSIIPSCRVNAYVGNLPMISSNEFAIVARGN